MIFRFIFKSIILTCFVTLSLKTFAGPFLSKQSTDEQKANILKESAFGITPVRYTGSKGVAIKSSKFSNKRSTSSSGSFLGKKIVIVKGPDGKIRLVEKDNDLTDYVDPGHAKTGLGWVLSHFQNYLLNEKKPSSTKIPKSFFRRGRF